MSTSGPSDIELLESYRAGSEEAFRTLFERHKDVLYLHARAVTGEDGLAEDLVNEAFLKLARLGDAVAPEPPTLRPLLHTTLRRLALDRLRSEKAARRREAVAGARWIRSAKTGAGPEEGEELNRALPRLPPEQLEAVILHVYAGLTFQEVADAVEVPLGTIISRYRTAVGKLAQLMGGSR